MKILIVYFALIPLVVRAQLSMKMTRELSQEALLIAKKKSKCIAFAVVDKGGSLIHFERSRCAHLGSIETSIQKAKSAALFRKPTSDFANAVKNGRMGILSASGVIAVEGGLPIYLKSSFKGAIGIGGATSVEDEEFGKAVLKKFNIKLER